MKPWPPRPGLLLYGENKHPPLDSLVAAWNRFVPRRGRLEVTYMPGNPEECRLHALICVRLAQTSVTRQARDHFAKLARTWIRLADDLERSRAFIDEIAADSEATG